MGDWKIVLVIGEDNTGALVTIVERKPRFRVSIQVDGKSAKH